MATGIRQGRARFGDDVRERAKKWIAEQQAKKSAPKAAAKPAPKAKSKPKAVDKPKVIPMKEAAKANPVVKQMGESEKVAKEVIKSKYGSAVPEQPEYQRTKGMKPPASPPKKPSTAFGPRMTFPRDVGTDKAAEARRKMWGDDKEPESKKVEPTSTSASPYSSDYRPKSKLPQQKGGLGVLDFFVSDEDKKKAGLKKGGKVKAKGGSVSKRADGCAQRGKTKGRMI